MAQTLSNPILSVYDEQGNKIPIPMAQGDSAYQVAIDQGFKGTKEEWLQSLHGKDNLYVGEGPMPPGVKVKVNPNGRKIIIPEVDKNLKNENDAADAKVVGDRLAQVYKTTCLPFEEKGAIVNCHPALGGPLHVVSEIAVKQEGTGDPSPTNVRLIVMQDKVELTRCGENVLPLINGKWDFPKTGEETAASARWETLETGEIVINGTNPDKITTNQFTLFLYPTWNSVLKEKLKFLIGSTVTLSGCPEGGGGGTYHLAAEHMSGATLNNTDEGHGTTFTVGNITEFEGVGISATIRKGVKCDNLTFRPQISLGSVAAPYTPYNGSTYTAQLPEPVAGGTVDWEKGVLTKKIFGRTYDGSPDEKWNIYKFKNGWGGYIKEPSPLYPYSSSDKSARSNYLRLYHTDASTLINGFYLARTGPNIVLSETEITIEQLRQMLADKPLQIIYTLAEPTLIPLTTPSSTPTALPGVNTLYSDTGDTTVSGYVDALYTSSQKDAQIADLTKRLEALESKQIDTQAAIISSGSNV